MCLVATFAKHSIVDVWQCSEFLGTNHTWILNMLLVLNMLGFWIYLSRNIRQFRFLKYESSISWNIRISFVDSVSWNIRTAFFWENIRSFLILEHKKFSWGGFFFLFFELRLKSVLDSCILYYCVILSLDLIFLNNIGLTVFQKTFFCLNCYNTLFSFSLELRQSCSVIYLFIYLFIYFFINTLFGIGKIYKALEKIYSLIYTN